MASLREELQKTQELYHSKYQTVLKEMLNDIRRSETATAGSHLERVEVCTITLGR